MRTALRRISLAGWQCWTVITSVATTVSFRLRSTGVLGPRSATGLRPSRAIAAAAPRPSDGRGSGGQRDYRHDRLDRTALAQSKSRPRSLRGARLGAAERTPPHSAGIGGLRTMSRALAPHSDLFLGHAGRLGAAHRAQPQGFTRRRAASGPGGSLSAGKFATNRW